MQSPSSLRCYACVALAAITAVLACSEAAPKRAGAPAGGAAPAGSPAPVGAGGQGGTDAPAAASGATGGAGGSGGTAAGAGAAGGTSSGGSGAAGTTAGAGRPADAAVEPAPDAGSAPDAGGASAAGDALWLSPDGMDTQPGTETQPLKTLAAAVKLAKPGTTIWVVAGTYATAQTVSLSAVGTAAEPIAIFAAPGGARPVFDFAAQPRDQSSARGLQISGSYWHLRGIDVINAGDNCIHVSGSHNTIERVVTHGCSDTGVQITANSSEAGDPTRAAHNLVLNCDSYDNYDAANQGENADGFAAKLYIGPGNVFRGCRAWNNADDGWDLFASDDVVVIEDCWAIANGKIGPGQNNTNGDGNGFKLGGAARAGDANMGGAVHQVSRCASVENRACGFTLNNNTSAPNLSMCGGRGDGKGLLCSLSNSGALTVEMTAAEAIAAQRDADGKLPAIR